MNDKVVLEVRGIVKDFPGLRANDNISFQLHEGEILTLLGENGAGKTTLMNIIMGIYKPDAGEILVNGEPVHISDPREAIASASAWCTSISSWSTTSRLRKTSCSAPSRATA